MTGFLLFIEFLRLGSLCNLSLAAVFDIIALGADVASLGEGNFGHHGAEKLINKHAHEDDVADNKSVIAKIGGGGEAHAKGNTGLREQSYAKILGNNTFAAHGAGGNTGTYILAYAASDYVNNTDDNHEIVGENVQAQLSAAEYEEEGEKRSGPAVGLLHKFIGEGTGIAENCAQHHANKQGGKTKGNIANLDFQHTKGNGDDNKTDDESHTVAVGVVELFDGVKYITHNRAQNKG